MVPCVDSTALRSVFGRAAYPYSSVPVSMSRTWRVESNDNRSNSLDSKNWASSIETIEYNLVMLLFRCAKTLTVPLLLPAKMYL